MISPLLPGRLKLGGSKFKASPGNNSQDPISTNSWVWWLTPVIPATMETETRRIAVRLAWAKSETLSQNNQSRNGWWCGTYRVPAYKCEALSSNISTALSPKRGFTVCISNETNGPRRQQWGDPAW
jgi:hypothetical protein